MEREVWSPSQQGCRHVWIDWFQNTRATPLEHGVNQGEVIQSLTHWCLNIRVPHPQEVAENAANCSCPEYKQDQSHYTMYLSSDSEKKNHFTVNKVLISLGKKKGRIH